MARGGEAVKRVALLSALTQSAASGPDGGMLDKTYDQARAMRDGGSAAAVIPGAEHGWEDATSSQPLTPADALAGNY